jgi:hypothetical protein
MNKLSFLIIILVFVFISASGADSSYDSVNVATFGKVYIYKKTELPQNIVIMISGDGGWKYGVVGFAETFSDMNSLVIGVDILRYFKDLRRQLLYCCGRFCTISDRNRKEIQLS